MVEPVDVDEAWVTGELAAGRIASGRVALAAYLGHEASRAVAVPPLEIAAEELVAGQGQWPELAWIDASRDVLEGEGLARVALTAARMVPRGLWQGGALRAAIGASTVSCGGAMEEAGVSPEELAHLVAMTPLGPLEDSLARPGRRHVERARLAATLLDAVGTRLEGTIQASCARVLAAACEVVESLHRASTGTTPPELQLLSEVFGDGHPLDDLARLAWRACQATHAVFARGIALSPVEEVRADWSRRLRARMVAELVPWLLGRPGPKGRRREPSLGRRLELPFLSGASRAVLEAVEAGDDERAARSLRKRAKLTREEAGALLARTRDAGLRLALLERDPAASSRDELLVRAAEDGQEAVVELLLARGASPDAGHEETALGKAVARGHAGVVRLLLAAGADPNLAAGRSRPPLHGACRPDLVDALVGAGADVSITDDDGLTARASHESLLQVEDPDSTPEERRDWAEAVARLRAAERPTRPSSGARSLGPGSKRRLR